MFGAALGFSCYLIYLMPIGAILGKIDLPHWLWSFHVWPLIGNGGSGGLYIRVVRLVQLFENARSRPKSDPFFDVDHDELIEMYIFLKKSGAPTAFAVK